MSLDEDNVRYIITSNAQVKEVSVIRVSGEFCTIRFKDTDTVIRVRESRLYKTRENALLNVPEKIKKKINRSPWDYNM